MPPMDLLVSLKKIEDVQLRAWFEPCCLCFGERQTQSMVREVVKDGLVARRIFEKVLPKMDC
jgi:hypothetical protein